MPRRDRFDEDDQFDDDRPRRRRRERDDDDEDDRPRRDDDREPPANGPATTALILGILSFVGGLTAIPGLICGFVGLSKAKALGGAGQGTAVAGTVLSGVGVIVLGLTVWLVIWLVGRNDERKTQNVASNNLKQIGLAMHNFHDANGQFSTGIARGPNDVNGRPIRENELTNRLSWRVDLLPYLGHGQLFDAMNLSEPWDSPVNRSAMHRTVSEYSDPDARTDPATRWRTFYGPGTPFDPAFGAPRLSIISITDGTSNTVYVAEGGEKVTWNRFGEIKFDPANPPQPSAFGRPGKDTFQVLMFDGSVRELRKTIGRTTFGHIITHNGGEVVGGDW